MSKLTRENAILPTKTFVSLKNNVGSAVVYKNHITLGTNSELWNPNDHAEPNAIVVFADEDSASIAMLYGGLSGTVKVKLMESVARGSRIYPFNDGTNIGFADREEERNSGTFYMCGMALEDGVAGEMVEAVLFKPEAFTVA
jgi:hypothetical protein